MGIHIDAQRNSGFTLSQVTVVLTLVRPMNEVNNGKRHFSRFSSSATLGRIFKKIADVVYVGDPTPHACKHFDQSAQRGVSAHA